MKIIHTADWQIELRKDNDRKEEYNTVLFSFLKEVKKIKPEYTIITGDIFEFWQTTPEERDLFKEVLLDISKYSKYVIITNGNHDLKQQNNFYYDENGKQVPLIDDIENIMSLMKYGKNLNNVHYLNKTGWYVIGDIQFGVWNHKSKFHPYLKEPYKPDPKEKKDGIYTIELFHDPIKDCIDFDDRVVKGSNETRVDIKEFSSPLVLAGDIHKPNIYKSKNTTFTYCSSLIERNYGEGNYYRNGEIYQTGSTQHGYNLVELDVDNGTFDIKLVPINNPFSRHTFYFDVDGFLEYDFKKLKNTEIVKVKFEDDYQKFLENEQKIHDKLSYFKSYDILKPSIITKVVNTANIDVNNIDKTLIKQLFQEYITTQTDDEVIREEFLQLVNEELVKYKENTTNTFTIKRIKCKNFKILNDLDVNFEELSNKIQISANNGVGKTTIYHLILSTFTDLISSNQPKNQTKNNNFNYFNDVNKSDKVEREIEFTFNGEDYKIVNNLTRKWKKTKAKKDIRKNISSIDQDFKVYNLTKDKQLTTSQWEDIKNIIVKDFDQFYDLLFVNNKNIDKYKDLKIEELIENIINGIGVDYFHKMLKNYDDVKNKYLDKVEKSNLKNLSDGKEEISSLKEDISTFEANQQQYTKKINTYKKELKELEKEKSEIRLVEIDESLLMVDEDLLSSKIDKLNHSIETTKDSINLLEEEKENLNVNIDKTSKQNELEEKQKELEEINNNLQEYKTHITEQEFEINVHKREIERLEYNDKQIVQGEIVSLESDIKTLKGEMKNMVEKGKILRREQTLLEGSKCQNCGFLKEGDQERLSKITIEIDDLLKKHNEQKEEQKKHQERINYLEEVKKKPVERKEVRQKQHQINTIKNEMVELEKLIKKTNSKKEEVEKEIKIKKQELLEIDNQINKYHEIKDQLHGKHTDLNGLEKDLSGVQAKLDKYNREKENIVNNKVKKELLTKKEQEITEIGELLEEQREFYQQISTKITLNESKIKDIEKEIEKLEKYNKVVYMLKLYKTSISKKGVILTLFGKIMETINGIINELLEGFNFTLIFEKDETDNILLYMYDKLSDSKRDILLSSGMENLNIYLTLTYALKKVNNVLQTKQIFIDEITGTLNNGENSEDLEGLTQTRKNYQETFIQTIRNISRDYQIFIIDHVIDSELLGADRIVPYRTKDGSNVKIIKNGFK